MIEIITAKARPDTKKHCLEPVQGLGFRVQGLGLKPNKVSGSGLREGVVQSNS